MMQQAMSRKMATTGGFATSVAIHAGLFLLLMVALRMSIDQVDEVVDEISEISYIEERYGEDVAKQVRMKTQPTVKPEEIAKEAEPAPETKPAVEPEVKPEPVEAAPEPALQSKPKLTSLKPPKLETRSALKNKPMDIDAPRLTAKQRQQFQNVTDAKLDSKSFADVNMPKLDTSNLRNAGALAADVNAPKLASKSPAKNFQGDNVALVGRKSKTDLSDVDFEVSSGGSGGRMALQLPTGGVEGGNAALVGGRLDEGQEAWQGSVDELVQTAQANERRKALADDVAAPALKSRSSDTGRRTVMDYGKGDPGRRGSLRGGKRPALAEAPSAATIAKADETPVQEAAADLADAQVTATAGKGVAMTISGQITGRKIVNSTLPVYSEKARKMGWEGVVAVHFTVMPDGRVKDNVYFEQTSPHRDLNRAAMDAIKQFVFESLSGADRVEQWGVITIVFRLS